jgi:hypothetical protein
MFNEVFSSMQFKNPIEQKVFENLFNMYMSDLPANFYANQFELQKKYTGTKFEQWVKMLEHLPFKNWKDKQVSLIVEANTNKALGGDMDLDREALNVLKLKKDIVADEGSAQLPTIIVIPESLYIKDEDKDK